jgi:hypothetical protein
MGGLARRVASQAGNGHVAAIIAAGNGGARLTSFTPCQGFSALVCCQHMRPANLDAPRYRLLAALTGASLYQLAFELGEATKHGQHQAAVHGGSVGPRIRQRLEGGASLGNAVKRVEQVSGGARQPIQASDNDGIAGLKCLDQLGQLRRSVRAPDIFSLNTLAAPAAVSCACWASSV